MKQLNIIKNDPWLEPFSDAIEGRHNDAVNKERELTSTCKTLDQFANAYNYFGLHRTEKGGFPRGRTGRWYAPSCPTIWE